MLYSQSTTNFYANELLCSQPSLLPKTKTITTKMDNLASDIVTPEHAHNHLPHTNTVTILKDTNCSHFNLELIGLQPPQVGFIKKKKIRKNMGSILSCLNAKLCCNERFHSFLLAMHSRRVLFWCLKPSMKGFI